MKLTDKYYVDKDGDMVGYPKYCEDSSEVQAKPFHSKLRIVRIGWLNNGFYLDLEDENGKMYSMNDTMFRDYLDKNDMYIEGDWNFYKQGVSFSIGL